MQLEIADFPVPPRAFRNHDEATYFPSAAEDMSRIADVVGISAQHKVFDIGCAAGRLAFPLLRVLDPAKGGKYLGIDVKPGAIQWAQEHITRHYPHFRFQHLDARSGVVNPSGALSQSELSLPVPDGEFDLVLMRSVFTHMVGDGIVRYLKEISRCLVSGGSLYASAFLFDLEAWKACLERKPDWNFHHRLGDVMVHDPKRPEHVTAIFEEFLYRVCNEHDLRPVAILKGAWRQGGPGGQDLLFFKKH